MRRHIVKIFSKSSNQCYAPGLMMSRLTKGFALRVIPPEAGIQKIVHCRWIPASAGMTLKNV